MLYQTAPIVLIKVPEKAEVIINIATSTVVVRTVMTKEAVASTTGVTAAL